MNKDKEFLRAALKRAQRTVAQTLAGAIPAGFVITPAMIQDANWSYLYIIIAWVATGLVAGLCSLIMSYATGLPEVESDKE